MAKILVVDDEVDLQTLIKQKFRQEIKGNQYDFVFAINGIDALEKIKENPAPPPRPAKTPPIAPKGQSTL